MKKILSVVLSVVLVLSCVFILSSCNSLGTKTYDIYMNALEKLNKAESVLYKGKMNMEVAGDECFSLKADFEVSQVTRSESDMDLKMVMSIDMYGMKLKTTSYFKDGFLYTETMGHKMKMEMPLEEAISQQLSMKPIEFPATAIKNETVKDTKDGGKKISFKLDGSAVDDLMDMLDLDGLGISDDGSMDMKFNDFELSVTVDNNGDFKTLKMDFAIDINANGEAMNIIYNITMNIVQIGGVTVNFPADLDTYEHFDLDFGF
jgi:hypothetical protein